MTNDYRHAHCPHCLKGLLIYSKNDEVVIVGKPDNKLEDKR